MIWLAPEWLWALVAVAALAALVTLSTLRHHARLDRVLGATLARRALPDAVRRRRHARDALALTGLALVVVALADPRAPVATRTVQADGVDLVIALDLSRSMDARDVDPSRLERARREISDTLDLLEGDRVGLVVFAGGAWPRMPLSLDHGAMRLVTREADTRMFEAQGSTLGEALRVSQRLLTQNPDDAGRAVLVLSDGEVHDPADALAAADAAAAEGIAVYGLVVGTAAAPIPEGDGRFVLDPATRSRVMSEPTDAVLQDVARRTGGAVAHSVPSDADVRQLLALMRGSLRAGHARDVEQTTADALFPFVLTPAALMMLLAAWWGDGRGRRSMAALALALAMGLASPGARAEDPASPAVTTAADADALYRAGRFAEAARAWESLARGAPDDADTLNRLGAARYRAGDYAGAARAWTRVGELTGDPNAWYNAGNADWQSGRLDRAANRYDQALAAQPDHAPAQQNRAAVAAELEQRKAQRPPSEPPPQQGGGDPSKDPQPPSGEQPGPPGEAPPQPGEGGDSSGSPPSGQADAQPPSDPRNAPSPQAGTSGQDEGQPGEGDPEGDGTRPEQGESPTTALDGATGAEATGDPSDGDATAAGTSAAPPTPGASAAAAAARTLDGVEEGRPRVYTPGRRTDKPW
jgi:Ca-activated chloride channel family protein